MMSTLKPVSAFLAAIATITAVNLDRALASTDEITSCPPLPKIELVDGEAQMPPLPVVQPVGEHSTSYTLFNRTSDRAVLDTFSLVLNKNVPVSVSGLGLFRDGKQVFPKKSSERASRHYLGVAYGLAPDLDADVIADVFRISVHPKPPSARSTVVGLQRTWSEYCELKQKNFGLYQVFDNQPDDTFDWCGGKPDTEDRSFVSSDTFNADTVIECLGSTVGSMRSCNLRIDLQSWNVSVQFHRNKLHRWREIRADLLQFMKSRSCLPLN
jgi:hypothetical protein